MNNKEGLRLSATFSLIIASLIIIVLSCQLSSATLINKQLFNISDCYNLTVTIDLIDGNVSPSGFGFYGLSQQSDASFSGSCFSSNDDNWSLVLQSDNGILRDPRVYNIHVKANVFSFKKRSMNFNVNDWGDYVDLGDLNLSNIGKSLVQDLQIVYINNTIVVNDTVEKVVYQNRTFYQDRIVYVNQSVPVEKIVYVNQTIISYVNVSDNNSCKQVNFDDGSLVLEKNILLASTLLTIVTLCIISYSFFSKQKKNNDEVTLK